MKTRILFGLVLLALLPLVQACTKDNNLMGGEWVNEENEETLSFETKVAGVYSYIAYAGITGERTNALSRFTYRYNGESEGEVHLENLIQGCIISSPTLSFTVSGNELRLHESDDRDVVFVRK